jgi:pimeloyl-ACP methyl ester carboxylesterase
LITPVNAGAAHLLPGLPAGIRSRYLADANGLQVHILEAGFDQPADQPVKGRLLLLHGFPELAYSWRKVMLPLAQAGFHVVAPDQRGYGRTTGWHGDYDGDLAPSRPLNLVQDALAVVSALGWPDVSAVVGHDFGSSVAAWCALVRPDVFRAVVMMSAPFGGPPAIRPALNSPNLWGPDLHAALAQLPRPRKHYQWYYATREADANMRLAPQGIHAFLRAYYHHKSADWPRNQPFKLAGVDAVELAKMPTYYLMDLAMGMAETVAFEMPHAEAIAACRWLPDGELAVYAAEFARTGFQGALNWYRASISETLGAELKLFSGRTIDVPSLFIAGQSDWGIYQKPGAFEAMQHKACTRMKAPQLIPGAGHWVQQEKPGQVRDLLLSFLEDLNAI